MELIKRTLLTDDFSINGINTFIFPTKFSLLLPRNFGGISMIKVLLSCKNDSTVPDTLLLSSETKKGMIPAFSNAESFSVEVVDPFTKNPFPNKAFAKGKPNQPQPRMLIFVIFIFKLFDF